MNIERDKVEKLIRDLAALPSETETVEFKENHFQPEEIGKRISALANAANLHDEKCAYLVFGIQDSTHAIVGTVFSPKTEKMGGEQLEFWLSKSIEPKIDYVIYETEVEGKRIVLFAIPPAVNQPIKFNGVAYIRVGSTTPKLSDYPEKERKIWVNVNQKSFEKGIAKEHQTISEVLALLDYAKYFALTKQELPKDTSQFVARMAQHGLVRKVFGDNYDITNLGAVLFAKDLDGFPTVKRKAVRVIVYKGVDRVEREKEQEGHFGYVVSFESLLDYINDKLPYNEEISRALRKEARMYPEVAIREFVANALIHQDLSLSGAGPLIEIFKDRIEITNTGQPLIETDRFIDHPPRSRNEDMAAFMRLIGVCEEGGTGVDRALINIALYQLPAPKFEKYDEFTKVTLYAKRDLKHMTLDDKIRACYQHCVLRYVQSARMTNATLRERLGIEESNYPAATAIINATKEKGLVKESEKPKEYVPIWA